VGSLKPLGNVLARFKRHYFFITALCHPNTVELHLDCGQREFVFFSDPARNGLATMAPTSGRSGSLQRSCRTATADPPMLMNGFPVCSGHSKRTQLVKRTLALFGSAKASIGADRYRRCTPSGVKTRYPAVSTALAIVSSISTIN